MINDESSAWECINKLHQMGPKQIVITSTNLSREGSMVGFFSDNINDIRGSLIVPELVDNRLITDENKKGFVEFTGTGDMFAACLCGHSGRELTRNYMVWKCTLETLFPNYTFCFESQLCISNVLMMFPMNVSKPHITVNTTCPK